MNSFRDFSYTPDYDDSFTPEQLNIISKIAAGDPDAIAKYTVPFSEIPEPLCCADEEYAFDPD